MEGDVASTLSEVLDGSEGWVLEQAYRGGSQGADQWASRAGHRVIVKRHTYASAVQLQKVRCRINTLRSAGVPAPTTWVADAGSEVLLIHDYLPGRADPVLNSTLVEDLIRIVDYEIGLADESAEDWPALIRTSLTVGLDGYQEHRAMEQFNDVTRSVLQRVRDVGRDPLLDKIRAPDLIHYDLHTVNVVSEDGRCVSGIIDWDGVRAGDRVLDLGILAFTSTWKTTDLAIIERLWDAFLARSSHDARVAYMHLTALRQVDWVIRHPGLPPGPERVLQLASWGLTLAETERFVPPPI